MTTAAVGLSPSRGSPLAPRKKALENEVLGISIFIISELMFFTALISAYLVIKAATESQLKTKIVRLGKE